MTGFRMYVKPWSVSTLYTMSKDGEINFNSDIQRGEVWSRKAASLYIHSLLMDLLEYQSPFLASLKEDENGRMCWYILDGKQRGTTLIKYLGNEFALTGLQEEPPIIVGGETVKINGKRFCQLPIKLQNKIRDCTINVACLENTDAESYNVESLIFRRFNNGTAMTRFDIARSYSEDMKNIKEIAKHPIFSVMYTEKKAKKLPADEDIVKCWIALYEENPQYSAPYVTRKLKELSITEEQKEEMLLLYDRILAAYETLISGDSDAQTAAKEILTRINMTSYISSIDRFDNNIQLADWLKGFYSNQPLEYQVTKNHSTSTANIQKRLEIVRKSIDGFLE